jgi:hypothetical protein
MVNVAKMGWSIEQYRRSKHEHSEGRKQECGGEPSPSLPTRHPGNQGLGVCRQAFVMKQPKVLHHVE